MYVCMYACMYVCRHTCLCICPPPPPPPPSPYLTWYGLVGVGEGRACVDRGRGSWRMGCCCGGGQGSQRGPGSYASHKRCNVARAAVFVSLDLYCIPTPNPKPRLNAGFKLNRNRQP